MELFVFELFDLLYVDNMIMGKDVLFKKGYNLKCVIFYIRVYIRLSF